MKAAIGRVISICPLLLMTSITAVATEVDKTSAGEKNSSVLPFDLYRTPAVPIPIAQDRALNCLALEQEIARLVPKTYSYKPDFYNDPYQGSAIWIGTTLFMPAYALSGYVGYLQYRENGRIIPAEERIEVLRHLKAQHHCFET